MRAVVLVGGFGTRLRPLTLDTPKQMLPVVDRPMIEWVVGHLGTHGVEEAVLSLGFRPEPFMEHYRDGVCAGVRLRYVVEDEPLDTAGAVRFAATEAGIDERFLVLNGDVLTDLDIGALVAFHDAAGAEGTIHLHRVDDPSRYGVVPVDDDGRVLEFVEKPPPGAAPSHWINAGTYVLEPSVLTRIPSHGKVSIERETFPAMVADRSLFGFHADDYWIDTGTPATYVRAQLDLAGGVRAGLGAPAIAADAMVDGAVVSDAVVMAGAVVAAGATVREAAVLPGVRIAAGARVEQAVLGAGASIGEDAVVEGWSIVGPGVDVPAGAHLDGARVPSDEPAA
jgi:mannose-1-phosphate guanylyltransferase